MTLSDNLERLMLMHGHLSVSTLARLTNIPQPTLHHILSGSTKKPRKKALEALAGFFSISIPQLIGLESLPHIIPNTLKEGLKLHSVPILQWDMLKWWPVDKINRPQLSEIILNQEISDHSFALVVQDALFDPLFSRNDLLIFDGERLPKDRDFVMAHIAGDDSIFFNRVFIDNDEMYMKQQAKDGASKLITLDKTTDRIIGTLIEVRIQY